MKKIFYIVVLVFISFTLFVDVLVHSYFNPETPIARLLIFSLIILLDAAIWIKAFIPLLIKLKNIRL
jgi:hypothetical protein